MSTVPNKLRGIAKGLDDIAAATTDDINRTWLRCYAQELRQQAFEIEAEAELCAVVSNTINAMAAEHPTLDTLGRLGE